MAIHSATAYQRRRSLLAPVLPRLVPHGLMGPRADRFVSLNRFYLDGSAYGGLVGSVADAARFVQMHLRNGELDGARILSAAAARDMREIQVPG